jgi:2-polyprenylphenol 6-hydroxylase
MAGQGINLGFRDIIDLTRTLQQKSPMQKLYDTQLLKKYTRSRKADVANIQLLTDGLFKLFSMQYPALQKVRQLGFNATKIAKVKQLLLKVALAQ